MARKRTLEHSLWTIGQTVCQACSGYGHGAKNCPTAGKLDQLRIVGGAWLRIARTRVSGAHVNDQVIRHNIPRRARMNGVQRRAAQQAARAREVTELARLGLDQLK